MIDTRHIGAGSYPEPPEEKCYDFTFEGSITGKGYVFANSKEEARKLIESSNYNDLLETSDIKIEEITGIKEDK